MCVKGEGTKNSSGLKKKKIGTVAATITARFSVNLKDLPVVRVHVLTRYKMNVPVGQIGILVITM